MGSMYCEDRSGRIKFYDNSDLKIGRQAFSNRLKDVFNVIHAPITFRESNAQIRTMLKKELGFDVRTSNGQTTTIQETFD